MINNNKRSNPPWFCAGEIELCFFRQQQSENGLSVVSTGCVVLLFFEMEAQVNNKSFLCAISSKQLMCNVCQSNHVGAR